MTFNLYTDFCSILSCSVCKPKERHGDDTWVGVYFFPHTSSIRPFSAESPARNYDDRTNVAYCKPYRSSVPEIINLESRDNNRNHGSERDSADYEMQDDDETEMIVQ